MKRISEYFGSGQRSSGDDPLEPVGDLADGVHRRQHRRLDVLGLAEHVAVLRVVVRRLERDRDDELVDQLAELALQTRRRPVVVRLVERREPLDRGAGSSIVRAIDAAVSASMLSFDDVLLGSTS